MSEAFIVGWLVLTKC